MTQQKKLYIKTYGCQMNVYDSTRIAESMQVLGYHAAETADDADMIVLNTCHIREKAAEKIYSELGRLKPLKTRNADVKIAVAGCVAQAEGEEILSRQPLVDLIIGPQNYHRLPALMARLARGERAIDIDFPQEDKFAHLPKRRFTSKRPAAFLTIQEGCDKFCSFCVVPYTRGAEASRPPERILEEARLLVAQGVRDITLLGQNVNAYSARAENGTSYRLSDLIYALAEIDGLMRIRFTTSHPCDMTRDLIDAFAACGKLMPYLHLPVQSGSDKILKAMNRRHSADEYIAIIQQMRAACPDILVSGDFIVGFPGETENDFADTLALVQEVFYGQSYSFKYSQRPGTPAANSALQVAESEKEERLSRLQTLLAAQQKESLDRMVGQSLPVLFEKPGRLNGQLAGRSPHLQTVCVDAPKGAIGSIIDVTIESAGRNTLIGRIAQPQQGM